jgi:amino acid adenylation domain-containing protein
MTFIDGFRISPQQRRLWALGEGDPGSLYQARAEVRIDGELDPSRLAEALRAVTARHEILRTTFPRTAGMSVPVQVVRPALPPVFSYLDLAAVPAEVREGHLTALRSSAAAPAFDLAEEPVLVARAIRLAPGLHRLFLWLPAACADTVTLGLLAGEIARETAGRATEDDEVLQYADLAESFNELAESEEAAAGREHWAGIDAVSGLEVPLPRWWGAEDPAGEAEPLAVALPEGAPGAAAALAQEAGVPLAAVLLAGWMGLLYRLSHRSPLLCGTLIDGRSYEGLDQALGLFARFLPLQVEIAPDLPFRALAQRVAAALEEAEPWQDSFDWEHWAGSDDGRPVPFFGVAFELCRRPAPLHAAGLTFTVERAAATVDRTGLLLSCEEGEGGLAAELRFAPELHHPREARRLAERYAVFLAAAVSEPHRRLGDLDLLGAEEARALLGVPGLAAAGDAGLGFPHLVEEQVRKGPERPAVRSGELIWTYRELNDRAGRLASWLARLGLGDESVVGICLESSPETLASVLGIHKAGGAFLPLEPTYPRERLAFLLEDSGAAAVVTAARWRHLVPESLPTVTWEELGETGEWEPAVESPPAPARRLAYVLYTSGSTGRPKGVLVEHRSLVAYLRWAGGNLFAGGVEALPAVTRLSFDASLKQLLAPLLFGGEVWFLPPGTAADPVHLLTALGERHGSAFNCVPSLWRELLPAVEAGVGGLGAGHPVALLLGGERLDEGLLERTFAALPGIRLWNLYGPTEVTANATAALLVPEGPVSLGAPLPHARVYLLDERLQPVPAGAAGEICVGGEGVARGYRGAPGLTAERFLPDAFAGTAGARLYRTGDLARHLPGGELEFLGRRDHQVKIRGFRVELGEIEARLLEDARVRQAAVVWDAGETGEGRLVAYVATAVEGVTGPELHQALLAQLPEHMVPVVFAVVPELPMTPGGKVDRGALPSPESVGSGMRAGYVAPRTPMEEILARIWADVLGVETVGAADNFFRLGGHSLLAIQLLSRLRAELDVQLPLRDVLEARDLAALAAQVEEARTVMGAGPAIPALAPLPRNGALPLSFSQERLWFLAQLDPASPAYNLPGALRLRGVLNVAALAGSLDEIRRRHEVLRTTYPTRGGRPFLEVAPPRRELLPLVDLSDLPAEVREAEALRLLAEEAGCPFDLGRGPLLRAGLLRLAEDDTFLFLTLHHIVSDGWSTAVLITELRALYAGLSQGRAVEGLPELPVQYADYAGWERSWLQGEELAAQVGYWRRQLAGMRETSLPTDRPRGSVASTHGATLYVDIPEDLAAVLRELGYQEGATPFMTLLAAFSVLLGHDCGQEDVVVGTDVANRHRPEVEKLIGFFTNQLVLRIDLTGDPGFRELVRQVRETSLDAYSHQALPFHKLVPILKPERDLSRNPLFQVMFSLQNAPRPELELAGLTLAPLKIETHSSVFDLSLYMSQTETGLSGALRYNTDLFDRETMRLLLERYGALLRHIAEAPGSTVGDLRAFLAEDGRRRLRDQAQQLDRINAERLKRLRRGRAMAGSFTD